MSTPAKPWPHNAEWCRCDCISLSRQGRTLLLESLDNINDPALLRTIIRASETFREIESKLASVGPNPDKEINHV